MIVLYDGSFENFLNIVFELYYRSLRPSKIVKEAPKELVFDEIYEIPYNEEESLRVLASLKEKFSKRDFETILNVFMCDSLEFEMDLLHYVIEGFKSPKNLGNINNPHILAIQGYQKRLFSNVHKMSAYLRFEELEEGSLYAVLDNQFNLVYFMGRHFAKRFNALNYYIHDIRRSLVFVHTKEFVGVREVVDMQLPERSKDEQKFQKLWKHFFHSVAIESRKNEKLQKNMVPLIYRTYMTEFMD